MSLLSCASCYALAVNGPFEGEHRKALASNSIRPSYPSYPSARLIPSRSSRPVRLVPFRSSRSDPVLSCHGLSVPSVMSIPSRPSLPVRSVPSVPVRLLSFVLERTPDMKGTTGVITSHATTRPIQIDALRCNSLLDLQWRRFSHRHLLRAINNIPA